MGVTDRQVTVTVRDPNPAAVGLARRLAAVFGRDANGAGGQPVHIGEKFDRTRRFSGYLAAMQTFRGAAWFGPATGAVRSPKVDGSRGLPNTQAPTLPDVSPILSGLARAQARRV